MRLVGNVFPNLSTGQLTAVVDENPQATFSSFKLNFNGGPKGTLTTPADLRAAHDERGVDPVVRHAGIATPDAARFTLTTDPERRRLPENAGRASVRPELHRRDDEHQAGAYSPFDVHIGGADGAAGAEGRQRHAAEGA